MPKFRKKPVVVEARQFTGGRKKTNADALVRWIVKNGGIAFVHNGYLYINTLESNQVTGKLVANEGDWIVKGVAGEFYPCKPDIFEQTYEEVPAVEY